MNNTTNEISATPAQSIEQAEKNQKELTQDIIFLCAIGCNNLAKSKLDIKQAQKDAESKLNALGAAPGLQEMLAAQMLSVHRLQQISMTMANGITDSDDRQYFSNTAIKLANTFVQQAALLNKLQNGGQQKIIVEHVDVHSGGQAVVGNITGLPTPSKEEK